jgi:hypothetical protein
MSYASKPGVCGRGEGSIQRVSRRDGWESDCEAGPVRVALERKGGRVTGVRSYVGGRWGNLAGVTDLGTVSAPQAAAYLFGLAESGGAMTGDPILPATLADSSATTAPLLRIARSQAVPKDTRRKATFWLSQEAGDAAVQGLAELAGDAGQDRDVREQAVFALSQLPDDQGVPALIRLAKTNPDPAVRKKAIFWLGQSEDPRALALFEALLAGRP